MLRLLRWLGTALVASFCVVGLGAVLSGVHACELGVCGGDDDPVKTDGQTVTVTVTGSLVEGGSAGSSGTTTVQVAPPCVYFPGMTGKEYYEYWHPDGQKEPRSGIRNPRTGEVEKPNDGYLDHKKDIDGHWYGRMCRSAKFDGNLDEFFDFASDWFDSHGPQYVPKGGSPPVPPVPPELLLDAAEEALTVPDPEFVWNPQRTEDQGTLVNFPTWFWLTPGIPTQGSVTASAGPTSVTVELGMTSVAFSGGSAGSVECPRGGTAWGPEATSDCTLAFTRAGTHTVEATTRWEGSWSYNGTPQGAVDPVGASWSADLAVSEIQSLVTGVS